MQYLLLVPVWIWLIVSALFFAYGEYLSKKCGLGSCAPILPWILLVNTVSMLAWLPAIIQKNHLAITGTIWLMLGLVAVVAIGIFVFNEHLTSQQWWGVGFAALAILLLSL